MKPISYDNFNKINGGIDCYEACITATLVIISKDVIAPLVQPISDHVHKLTCSTRDFIVNQIQYIVKDTVSKETIELGIAALGLAGSVGIIMHQQKTK